MSSWETDEICKKTVSINPRCVNCLKPHASLCTKFWGRGWLLAPGFWVLTYQYIRGKNSIWIIWKVSAFQPGSWAIPSPCSLFLVPNWTQSLALSTDFSQCCRPLPLSPECCGTPPVYHTTDHLLSLTDPGGQHKALSQTSTSKEQGLKRQTINLNLLKTIQRNWKLHQAALQCLKNQFYRSKGIIFS